MTETEQTRTPVMQRRSTRRLVLGGTIGAGTAALAYAALGGSLDGGAESGDETTLGSPLGSSPEETLAANTKTIESESGRISHLLRRAGFGVSREEFDRYQATGFDQTISELVNYQSNRLSAEHGMSSTSLLSSQSNRLSADHRRSGG